MALLQRHSWRLQLGRSRRAGRCRARRWRASGGGRGDTGFGCDNRANAVGCDDNALLGHVPTLLQDDEAGRARGGAAAGLCRFDLVEAGWSGVPAKMAMSDFLALRESC